MGLNVGLRVPVLQLCVLQVGLWACGHGVSEHNAGMPQCLYKVTFLVKCYEFVQ